MSGGGATLLFVVSNDFGELAISLGFVHGYPFQTRLLLPDRLFEANRESLPAPVARWTSVDDVLAAVASTDPDVVFLCSAYLYAFNGLVSVDDVERLIATLRESGRRVVTTDPFLGLLARPDASVFRPDHPRTAWLMEHFGRLATALRTVPHLYPVDVETADVESLAFFNPHVVVDRATVTAWARERTGWMDVDPPRPRWVFVLSAEDWARQGTRHGAAAFEALLVAKLDETARARRQPVLIAPGAVLDRLRSRTALIEGIALVPFTSHRLFTTLVLDAEQVFYWNVLSNSIVLRIANHQPVLFFDTGHVVHAIPALGDRGLAVYWCGVPPPSVDIAERLDAARLADMAQAQDRALEPTRARWWKATRPDALVQQLLGARA
jgi:hypothetical protein